MADQIHQKMYRDWMLKYIADDAGTPGLVDLTKSPTKVTMLPPDLCDVLVAPNSFDISTGTQTLQVQHNGAIGDVEVTVINDGDLGEGEHPISISRIFTMLAPAGAIGVSDSVSEEKEAAPPQATPIGGRRAS